MPTLGSLSVCLPLPCKQAKLIRRHGPWKHLEDVEFAPLEGVDWCNHRRLLGPPGRTVGIGHSPSAECEEVSYRQMSLAENKGLEEPT